MNYLNRRVGSRRAGLSYVVRDNETVSLIVPERAVGEPHSEEYGSIEGDLTHRLRHTYALYKVDNAEVFDIIETGVRGTDIASTIAPFRKHRDGRGALKAIIAQHAGVRVLEDMVKSAKEILGGSRKWTGTSNFTIAQHANVHRKAFTAMSEAGEHVAVQIPDERTRVTNLIDSFQTVHPDVLAALSSVCQDELSKRVNFELAVSFLIQSDPVVAKQKQRGVTFDANVSGVERSTLGAPKKSAISTTGVQLCHYKKEDFFKLTKPQRAEVSEWTKAHPREKEDNTMKRKKGDGKDSGRPPKKWKAELSAMQARSDEMFGALIDSQKVTFEAIQSQASFMSGKPAQAPSGVSEGVIITNERARVAMVRLQGILKSAPLTKSVESPTP